MFRDLFDANRQVPDGLVDANSAKEKAVRLCTGRLGKGAANSQRGAGFFVAALALPIRAGSNSLTRGGAGRTKRPPARKREPPAIASIAWRSSSVFSDRSLMTMVAMMPPGNGK
jgi:hypothetical protein